MKIPVHRGAASVFAAIIVRCIGFTWRIENRNLDNLDKARELSSTGVISFWHGRLLIVAYTHRKWGMAVLASEHPDGDLAGRMVARLGWKHVKGSSTRRGAVGFRELAAVLRSGHDVGLTIDGPRGPRGVAQQGATELSRMTGAAVIPLAAAARPCRMFESWDRFQLPGLFAKVVVAYGEPFVVSAGADREEREKSRLRLERSLCELTAEIDRAIGYEGSDVWPHEDH